MGKLGKGWEQIFHHDQEQVALPQELTKAWWDKKKQTIAKGKETGVGEQLEKLLTIFNQTDWPKVQPSWAKLDETRQDCSDFLKASKTEALRKQLIVVSKLAVEQSKLMKAGVLTKPTGKTLDEIDEAAHEALAALNITNLEKALGVAEEAAKEKIKDNAVKNIGSAFKALKMVSDKLAADMKDVREKVKTWQTDPSQENKTVAGFAIHRVSRGFTTPLGTIEKSLGKLRFTVEDAVIKQLMKDLEIYANDPVATFLNDVQPEQAAQVYNKAALMWARSKKLSDTIEVQV